MIRYFQHPWGWTTFAPLVCAVHCIATPALAVVAPSLISNPALEWSLLATTVTLATIALVSGVFRHGDFGPPLVVAGGLVLWTASLLHVFQPMPEDLTTTMAALVVASGLIWNSVLHCSARNAPCESCQHDSMDAARLPVIERAPSGSAQG